MSKLKFTKEDIVEYLNSKHGGSWLGDLNDWLKKTKIISKGISYVAPFLGKYGVAAEVLSKGVDYLGYGMNDVKKQHLVKFMKYKYGDGWVSDFGSWVKNKYHAVKDHINKHSNVYSAILKEFKPVNKIAHYAIDKLTVDDDLKKKLHDANDEYVGFGNKKPKTRKQAMKKKNEIKEKPLKPIYGKGFKNGQIP